MVLAGQLSAFSVRTRRWHVAVVSLSGRGELASRRSDEIELVESEANMRFSLGRGMCKMHVARRERWNAVYGWGAVRVAMVVRVFVKEIGMVDGTASL
jgi:hypothetical protein